MHSVEFAERAVDEIEKIKAWWTKHRGAAPSLFSDELARLIAVLSNQPLIGALIDENPKTVTRCSRLVRSGYNVFYELEEDGTVFIQTVRHLRRKPLRRKLRSSRSSKKKPSNPEPRGTV